MMDVCFVSVPFTPIERPLISFGLLQSILKKENISAATLYYNLDFAGNIGVHEYSVMTTFQTVLFGDWVFSKCLFSDTVNPDIYLKNLHSLLRKTKFNTLPLFHDRDYLLQLRNRAHDFLKEAAHEIVHKYNPRIAACSSVFTNHVACISLLKFIKELSPETITMIGGPNCDDEMGKTTHELFPFLDYVVSGYADHLITELVNKIFTYGQNMPMDEVPKQVIAPAFRVTEYKNISAHLQTQKRINLNELPVPDYNDYFEKLNSSSGLRSKILPSIPIESSRGCYWGKCTFCGLNSTHLNYRQKKWERVYSDIETLQKEHNVKKFMFVDNAVNFNNLSKMLDRLAHDGFDLRMWAEVRVKLRKEQLKKMREAGVIWVQAGIESLNDNFLALMNKGATMLQNIQLFKWAQQYGIYIIYNIMHSFPYEKDEWFDELADLIPFIVHLQPPRTMNKLRFDRFSDYYLNQSKYGLELKAFEFYSYVYPYDEPTLYNLAYFFEDKKRNKIRKNPVLYQLFGKPKRNFKKVHKAVNDWIASFYGKAPFRLMYEINEHNIVIHDTRPMSINSNYALNRLEGEIFLFSDEVRSIEEIHAAFASEYKITDIENAVRSLVDKKIVLEHKNNLLSLAVEAPVPSRHDISDFPLGTIIKDS
jgi:magnesium-protoporphyrin IX monomethyl ester (oxidative) cyclase